MDFVKKNIYYLNLSEIKSLCTSYKIPYKVYYEDDGKIHKSQIMLRKGKIIKNIIKTLDGKKVRKYIVPQINVNFDTTGSIYGLNNNIYFGQYKWTDAKKQIFPKYFKPVICQLMLFDLWEKNKSFTYKDFIKYYDKYYDAYDSLDHPEWKYIDSKRNNEIPGDKWKQTRRQIAKLCITKIKEIMIK